MNNDVVDDNDKEEKKKKKEREREKRVKPWKLGFLMGIRLNVRPWE